MNLIGSLLSRERITLDLDVNARGRLFEIVGQRFAMDLGLDAAHIVDSLATRERLGSTGLGHGIALPHARIKGLAQPVAAFVRLGLPISFDAPDGKPVSDLLVLLVPEQASEAHLQLLAELAQMFGDRRFRATLRKQSDAAGAHQTFAYWSACVG